MYRMSQLHRHPEERHSEHAAVLCSRGRECGTGTFKEFLLWDLSQMLLILNSKSFFILKSSDL